MLYAMFVLQGAVFIPLIVGIIFYKNLNKFLRIIFFSLLASLLSDAIGTFAAYNWGTNYNVYFIYFIVHNLLITLAWRSVKDYSLGAKRIVTGVGLAVNLATILAFIFDADPTIASSLNLALLIIFSLQYYTMKVIHLEAQQSIIEEKFLVASTCLLYSIPVLIIYGTFQLYPDAQFDLIWVVKQIFYLLFNILIAIVFYYYQKQNKEVR